MLFVFGFAEILKPHWAPCDSRKMHSYIIVIASSIHSNGITKRLYVYNIVNYYMYVWNVIEKKHNDENDIQFRYGTRLGAATDE